MATGLGVTLVGVVGLAAGLGETTTRSEAVTPPSGSTTTSVAAETPEEFLTALAAAFRNGDTTFLYDRLHSAVIDRYGEQACRLDIATATDPTAKIDVIRVEGTADYSWTSDGQTTVIPDTVSVRVTRVSRGVTVETVVHMTPVDGRFRWFTDCNSG